MNMSENKRGFASDNNAGVHPSILEALSSVNDGHVIAYGDPTHHDDNDQKDCREFSHGSIGLYLSLHNMINGCNLCIGQDVSQFPQKPVGYSRAAAHDFDGIYHPSFPEDFLGGAQVNENSPVIHGSGLRQQRCHREIGLPHSDPRTFLHIQP